jgi:hypothetical protein
MADRSLTPRVVDGLIDATGDLPLHIAGVTAFVASLAALIVCVLVPWVGPWALTADGPRGLALKVALSAVGVCVGLALAVVAFFIGIVVAMLVMLVPLGLIALVCAVFVDLPLRFVRVLLIPFSPGGCWNSRWKDPDRDVREAEVQNIGRQGVLAKIARYDMDSGVRKAAVSRITDASVLERISTTDPDESVRNSATKQGEWIAKLERPSFGPTPSRGRGWSGRWIDGGP